VLPVFAAGATQLPLKDLFQILRKLLLRGGSGNLNSRDKWIFCATAA
jgi:hypothetical protein